MSSSATCLATPHNPLVADCFARLTKGMTPTWEECCGRDAEYQKSMQIVLDHDFGTGKDGNGMELYFCVSEKGPDGKV